MAVRIRKLARELNRTPTELIGVLHALGLGRYRSVDDMLPAPAEARLRAGIKSGVAPVPVEVIDNGRPSEPEPPAERGDMTSPLGLEGRNADLMSQLVPGVVRAGAPRPPERPASKPAERTPVSSPERYPAAPPERYPGVPPERLSGRPPELRVGGMGGMDHRSAAPPSAELRAGAGDLRGSPMDPRGLSARPSLPELRARIAEPEAAHIREESEARGRHDLRDGASHLGHGAENGRGVPHHAPVVVDADWRALQAERAALDSARRVLESERAVLASEREAVEADHRRYEAQVRALDSERAALESLARALDLERGALEAERVSLNAQQGRLRASELLPMQDLLEERGLRGSDEFERAVAALAQGRLLRDVIWTIRVDSPDLLRRLLNDRMVLVDQVAPDALARAAATVAVSPDRAEVPSAPVLTRSLAAWGEGLLLHGLRRVTLVGGRSLWHRLLREGVDSRVDLRFVPARSRDGAQASADVERTDLVILWGVQVMPTARVIYNAARAQVIEVEDSGPAEMMAAVINKLHG
jgi:hypothetical protein